MSREARTWWCRCCVRVCASVCGVCMCPSGSLLIASRVDQMPIVIKRYAFIILGVCDVMCVWRACAACMRAACACEAQRTERDGLQIRRAATAAAAHTSSSTHHIAHHSSTSTHSSTAHSSTATHASAAAHASTLRIAGHDPVLCHLREGARRDARARVGRLWEAASVAVLAAAKVDVRALRAAPVAVDACERANENKKQM